MAYDAFLKIDGVNGESQRDGHQNEIEIYSFSWGASNPTSVGSGGKGMAAGRVSISSFNIMKKTDSASPTLFQKCCSGKHFDTATVVLQKAGGDKALDYLTYKFGEVFVESIQWSGSSGGDDTPSESVSFAFGKVEITYKPQIETGGSQQAIGAGWDIHKNVMLGGK